MPTRRRVRVATGAALLGWAGLIVVAVVWGRHLQPGGDINVDAPPFRGTYRLAIASVVPAGLFAAAAIVLLPTASRVLPWRALLPLSWVSAVVWAVLLAFLDGHQTLTGPIERRGEYVPAVAEVGSDPRAWLASFAERAAERDHPLHVNGHPPLMVLVLWVWDRIGFSGGSWAGALVIATGASAVVAVAVTLRSLGDERTVRTALPFLVLGPFAITVATSADAFFLGVGAWAPAALALGVRRGQPLLVLLGGILAGALPYLSYGLLPIGAVLVATVVLATRGHAGHGGAWSPSVVAALVAGLLVVPVLMTAGGFWWPDGVSATAQAWAEGKGDDRPYAYSFLADFAILGVMVGPATVVGATLRPRQAPMVLAGAALVAVSVLAVSGVTRLEVERIWLPFAPWMLLVCAALPRDGRRWWLAANAACALVFQALVLDVW